MLAVAGLYDGSNRLVDTAGDYKLIKNGKSKSIQVQLRLPENVKEPSCKSICHRREQFGTFDLYVNGDKKLSKVLLRNPLKKIDYILFGTGRKYAGELYIDDVKVTQALINFRIDYSLLLASLGEGPIFSERNR